MDSNLNVELSGSAHQTTPVAISPPQQSTEKRDCIYVACMILKIRQHHKYTWHILTRNGIVEIDLDGCGITWGHTQYKFYNQRFITVTEWKKSECEPIMRTAFGLLEQQKQRFCTLTWRGKKRMDTVAFENHSLEPGIGRILAVRELYSLNMSSKWI